MVLQLPQGIIMALIGYARVSTTDQDTTTQLERLAQAGCEKVFSEKMSGTSKKGRDALAACKDHLREGDTLVFTKIDRLARNAQDLQNLVAELEEKGIAIKSLDQSIDTTTPAGKAFLGMLGIFAEFETNIRKERQLEGIAKAKEKGNVYKGRKPTAMGKRAEVLELVEEGLLSKPKIAKKLGISIASVYNILKAESAK